MQGEPPHMLANRSLFEHEVPHTNVVPDNLVQIIDDDGFFTHKREIVGTLGVPLREQGEVGCREMAILSNLNLKRVLANIGDCLHVRRGDEQGVGDGIIVVVVV